MLINNTFFIVIKEYSGCNHFRKKMKKPSDTAYAFYLCNVPIYMWSKRIQSTKRAIYSLIKYLLHVSTNALLSVFTLFAFLT